MLYYLIQNTNFKNFIVFMLIFFYQKSVLKFSIFTFKFIQKKKKKKKKKKISLI